MSFKQRYNLALEEEQILADIDTNAPDNVLDTVEEMEAIEEIEEAKYNIEADNVAIEEAEAVVDELQEQVADNEVLLEQHPEAITEDIVIASQEAYYNSIGKLSYSIEDAKISLESGTDPISKFKLSTEGIKEFIADLISKIGSMIANFFRWLRIIWSKVQC